MTKDDFSSQERWNSYVLFGNISPNLIMSINLDFFGLRSIAFIEAVEDIDFLLSCEIPELKSFPVFSEERCLAEISYVDALRNRFVFDMDVDTSMLDDNGLEMYKKKVGLK
jgi:hypothetical protein